jgi:hypothetical protein
MTINAEWTALMPTTATFQNVSSRDVYGTRTGGTVVTFKCHIKYNRREAYQPDGSVVTFGGTVYMDDVYNVDKAAILNLPDGTKPKILNVQTFYDEVGPHHTTLDFEG